MHKYESIPLDQTGGLVRRKLETADKEVVNHTNLNSTLNFAVQRKKEQPSSVNYAYHPIIDFFRPYRE